eukprot:gene6286-10293_t
MDELSLKEVVEVTVNNSIEALDQTGLYLLLQSDPYLYLEKYGSLLTQKEFNCFEKNYKENYEVNWYLNKKIGLNNNKKIKNRRFNAIDSLKEYFSLEEMKQRRPELYSQILGNYYKERGETFDKNMKVYERILKNYDYSNFTNRILEDRKNDEIHNEKDEIHEKSDEENENFEYFIEKNQKIKEKKLQTKEENQKEIYNLKIDDKEIVLKFEKSDVKLDNEDDYLIQYFISEMKRKFIEGDDKDFDYSKVDNDESLDDINQMTIDFEEKYFEE